MNSCARVVNDHEKHSCNDYKRRGVTMIVDGNEKPLRITIVFACVGITCGNDKLSSEGSV